MIIRPMATCDAMPSNPTKLQLSLVRPEFIL